MRLNLVQNESVAQGWDGSLDLGVDLWNEKPETKSHFQSSCRLVSLIGCPIIYVVRTHQ